MIDERNTKLEIGCGTKRPYRKDFVGLDRFALPGVDVVFDLDSSPLPFPDNKFDLVYASHSLEHVSDLQSVMRELWRIMKPGAQLCILAPYYLMSVNFANPYHKQAFNEHTPRFWTASPTSRIPVCEYRQPPHSEKWGLVESDNSVPTFDFRCFRIEFFYFRKYALLSRRKLRKLRRTHNNVCNSILYHLVAFKRPMTETNIERMELDYYIPPEVINLRRKCAGIDVLRSALKPLKRAVKSLVRRHISHD